MDPSLAGKDGTPVPLYIVAVPDVPPKPGVMLLPAAIVVPTVSAVPIEALAVVVRTFAATVPENVGLLTVVMLGVPPPLDKILPEPVTDVTPGVAVAIIVSLGHVPVMLMPAPAIRLGVAVPVPPLAIGKGEVMEMLGFDPPVDARGLDAVTEATPPPPAVALIV
jgi:hypothetical protein